MNALNRLENRLPALLQKRGTAVAISLVLAVGSVLGFGGWKMHRQVQQTQQIFYEKGGIADSIALRAEAASNLVTLSGRLPGAQVGQELDALKKAMDELSKASGPLEESLADRQLEDAKIALVQALTEPSKADAMVEKMLMGQSAEFDSAGGRIAYAQKEYNQKADAVNRQLHSFPANIIGAITGVHEVEYCK